MSRVTRNTVVLCGAVFAFGVGHHPRAVADAGSGTGSHGGSVVKAGPYEFEVIFADHGLGLFPSTAGHRAVDTTGVSGTAAFSAAGSPTPWFSCPLSAPATIPGRGVVPLGAPLDLTRVPPRGVRVTVCVTGLPGPSPSRVEFVVPFDATPGSGVWLARATLADQASLRTQKVCKVGGGEFGWAAAPIKVTRGGRSVFVCCEACARKVEADPDRYLGPQAPPPAGAPAPGGGGHSHA